MTPSPTRPIFPRVARRTRLLAASALISSLMGGVAAMLAQPALAQTLPGIPGGGSITVSTGGSAPAITAPNANTLDVDLNAPRTVINWASLHVSGADSMIFHFDANSDIVLNKTTSQIAIDSGGTISGLVGASAGGNIWFYSPQGVIVSPGAVMTGGGFLFSRGAGIVDAGFVDAADPLANLRAATDALIRITTVSTATSASINSTGDVVLSASSGALNVAIAEGATVDVSTTAGSITASEVIATSGTAEVAAGGPGATVTSITGATGVTVSSGSNTSVGSATTTTSGDIVLGSGGSVSLTLGNSARDTLLTAPLIFLSTLDAGRDAVLTGTTGVTVTNRIFAGDDIELTASNGDITAGGAFLRSTGAGASDDAHILLRSDTGAVTATNTLQTQGTGTQAGDITVQAATTASAGTATATRDLKITGVTASLTSGTATRDVFVTATTGGATVTTQAFAGDDVEVTATTGAVSASGATLRSTGAAAAADAHVLARSTGSTVNVGTAQTQGTGAAAGDVIISAATTATLGSGGASRDLFVSATTGDATVVTSATAGDDVEVTTVDGDVVATAATLRSSGLNAGGDAHVLARSTNGAVAVGSGITQGTGAGAGDVTFDAGGAITGTSAESTRDVLATAAGDIDLASATAARDITVTSNGGQAILRAAVLTGTGAGHDLSVTAVNDAVLGDPDYTAITAANVFTRTGGNTGTATVRSTGGGVAKVHLDTSATIDTLEGASVDVTVNSGVTTFGTITALVDDIYVELLDGALTVGTATAATGDVDLNAYNGDLTLTGSAHGGGLVHLSAFGLLDGTSASLISSDGDLDLEGGVVDLGTLEADGAITVSALDGNLDVQSAQAGVVIQLGATGNAFIDTAEAVQAVFVVSGGDALVNLVKVTDPAGFVIVHGDGDATVRAAEAPDGILVDAVNKATFGADDEASITAANYVVTNPSCGCGAGGLQVVSANGDAAVYIDTASNGIGVVGAAQTGSAFVVQKTGNLTIEELAGQNITVKAATGTLETGLTTIADGDYTITAQGFLGDALTPTLFNGLIHDVTITDTLGGLNLGATAIHADHKLTIVAQNGGAVTGLGQLDAGAGLGDGEVNVTASAIALDTVLSDGDVSLDGGTGLVNVATSVTVDLDYTLAGGSFSTAALAPLGAKAGTWTLLDRAGDFNFTANPLQYGGDIDVTVIAGQVIGGDITSDAGAIAVLARGGHLGALSAGGGVITATGTVSGMAVDSAVLGGTGANSLTVQASNGDVLLGAATPGAITAAHVVTSTGATTTVVVSAAAGKVDVNLDHLTNAGLTTVEASNAVNIKVANGPLTVGQLTAGATSQVYGGGDTRLISADVTGDLTVVSAAGNLRFGDATPGRVIDVSGALSLNAATDIAQQGVLRANSLGVTSGTGVVLLGANQVAYLDAVTVSAGGFAFHDASAFDLYGAVNAVGQTVDLRSDGAIGQVSTGIITAQTLTGSAVGGANFGAANQVVQMGGFTNTGGLLKLVDGRSLTITGTVLSTGTVSIASHAGMTFAGAGRVQADGTGDAVILASDGVFTNARGADAVTAASGRWLIYTQAVGAPLGSTAGNTFNGLAGKSYYGSTYDFSAETFSAPVNAGNRFVYAYRPTLTVTADSRVVIYDGTVPTTSATITGLVNGDLAADAWSGAAVVSGATSKAAGTYVLTANISGLASDLNYAFTPVTGSLRIDPKALTSVLTANTRTYDGTAVATGSIGLTGVVGGDTVSASGAYAFADKTAGTGKTVTASGVALSGADAGNYTLASTAAGLADILKKDLTGALAANTKTYDRTTTATGSIGLTGVVSGDTVSASGTYAFADKNAATGKTVTASGVALSGGDAGNYTLVSTTAGTADILKKDLTGALTASNKTYDGTTAATGSIGLTGVVAGDTVSASGTYAFADKNAGTGKTVTPSGAVLAGADAGNYSLTGVSAALADILRRSVTVSADNGFKAFGQVEPSLSYRITVGDLAAGDAFTGALARAPGEIPGSYGILRGTLALSANYDITFTGAVFTIRTIPTNEQGGGSPALKYLNQSPDFTLDWDPESNLTTEGQPPQAAQAGGSRVVAALR